MIYYNQFQDQEACWCADSCEKYDVCCNNWPFPTPPPTPFPTDVTLSPTPKNITGYTLDYSAQSSKTCPSCDHEGVVVWDDQDMTWCSCDMERCIGNGDCCFDVLDTCYGAQLTSSVPFPLSLSLSLSLPSAARVGTLVEVPT